MNGIGLAVHRHGLLTHRLEQRGLRLRRGPVDLVDQEDVGEHRSRAERERHRLGVDDRRAGDVAREHVWRALDARGVCPHRPAKGDGQHRLADTRHVLEEDVASSTDGDHRQPHHVVLAVDDGVHVVDDLVEDQVEPLDVH
jgi:hypothetical protein